MSLQLYGIDQCPVSLPLWHTVLADLGDPPAARVARVLGIGRRTVYRYSQTGYAPRVVLLSLFWLTSWGRSAVHAQAVNDARVACGYVESLRGQVGELEARVAYLLAIGGTGAANDAVRGLGGTPR